MAKRKKLGKIETGITKKELAEIYNVTPKTFDGWIKPLRKKLGDMSAKSLYPLQIKIIIEHIGMPEDLFPKNAFDILKKP